MAKYISGIRFLFQTNRMPRAAAATLAPETKRHASGVRRQLAVTSMRQDTPAMRELFLSSRRFMTKDLCLQASVFMPTDTLKGRNIIRLGFAATGGLNRLGELAATINNKGKVPVAGDFRSRPNGLRTLLLRSSKTDTLFLGTVCKYPSDGSPTSAGAALTHCYYDSHFRDFDPNRPFFCNDHGGPILASEVVAAFRAGLCAAGIPTEGVLGHSFRRGGALDLYNAGVSPEKICIAGRWTSKCWKIYVTLSPAAWDCHHHYQLAQILNRRRSEQYFLVDSDLALARQIHSIVGGPAGRAMPHSN